MFSNISYAFYPSLLISPRDLKVHVVRRSAWREFFVAWGRVRQWRARRLAAARLPVGLSLAIAGHCREKTRRSATLHVPRRVVLDFLRLARATRRWETMDGFSTDSNLIQARMNDGS